MGLEEWVKKEQHHLPVGWKTQYGLLQREGLWYFHDHLIVVENHPLRKGILEAYHDHQLAGHPGNFCTALAISRDYWWPHMTQFIKEYIKGCATCQTTKPRQQPKTPLIPIGIIEAKPFQTVAIDLIVKLLTNEGFDSIITVTDHDCMKAAIFIPC